MTNQTTTAAKKARKTAAAAKAVPAANLRHVKEVTGANRGHDTIAILHDGSTHTVTDYARQGVTVKVGEDFDARKAAYLKKVAADAAKPKGPGHLAKGLDARTAPHSAKAVADNAAAARKGVAKPGKAEKKAARKTERAAKAAPKSDDNRRITIVDKKFTFGGDGTARRASWDAAKASKTVAEYAKAGGKLKYLPRWVSAGAIKLVG